MPVSLLLAQVLKELSLCCGAGGFAGLATTGVGGHHAEIKSQWAVDICRTAATTYKINNPGAHVNMPLIISFTFWIAVHECCVFS